MPGCMVGARGEKIETFLGALDLFLEVPVLSWSLPSGSLLCCCMDFAVRAKNVGKVIEWVVEYLFGLIFR